MLCFRLFGCEIRCGFSAFALLGFLALYCADSVPLLAAALLHELSHLLIMLMLGSPPGTIEISALGCRMERERQKALSYGKSALVSLAGPSGNLLAFAACAAFSKGGSAFAVYNLILAGFHFLPIEPLDGGLALRALLCAAVGSGRAEKLSLAASVIFLVPLSALGFLVLLNSKGNFSLLLFSQYLLFYLLFKRNLFDD